jgi:hypothetical protein
LTILSGLLTIYHDRSSSYELLFFFVNSFLALDMIIHLSKERTPPPF